MKLIQEIYESTYNKSLKKALEAKCGKKFFLALSALLVPPEEFLAMRLEKAMKGWGADDKVLIRILGGLDHASKPSMLQVADAYQRKYTRTLKDALRANIKGNFLKAATAWISALEDPAQHLEVKTNVDVDTHDNLDALLDDLLVEHNSVECMMADVDAQEIYNCCHGWGTSDGKLIALLCSRSKPHLQKVAAAYYEQRDAPLLKRLRKETSGWYKEFMTYLVELPEDADVRALDSAMNGIGADAVATIKANRNLNVDGLTFSRGVSSILMEATTVRLSNVNFPINSAVRLNSLKGPLDGKYPNFGSAIPAAEQIGRVNFIKNVSSGGNVLNTRQAFDQYGQNITIGKIAKP